MSIRVDVLRTLRWFFALQFVNACSPPPQYSEQQSRWLAGVLSFPDATDVRFEEYIPDESAWVFSYQWSGATPERWKVRAAREATCLMAKGQGPNWVSLTTAPGDCPRDIAEVVIRRSDNRVFVARAIAVMGIEKRRAFLQRYLEGRCLCKREVEAQP